jgi:hypothetical protein
MVELSPGVCVNRATYGQVWLGVPFGTNGFIAAELARQMVEHDQRQRGIATYASCNGDSVSHVRMRLSRSLALTALKFSANARDVHILRSLGWRAIGYAMALHVTMVLNTLAVVLGQAAPPLPGEPPMSRRPLSASMESFQMVANWLWLPTALGLRPWAWYGDVAHVAMWAQAYDSARMSVGGVEVCAYPTLKATLMQASELVGAPATVVTMGNALAWDLARAWTRLLADTLRAFPSPAQRLMSCDHGYWVTETGREVALVGLLQGKVQWRRSVGLRVLQVRDATTAGMHEAWTPGSAERWSCSGWCMPPSAASRTTRSFGSTTVTCTGATPSCWWRWRCASASTC